MTAKISCPTSWLVGSHISGAAFSNIIRSIREQGGKVESPDHVLQLSQLAAIHNPRFNGSVAVVGPGEEDLPRTRAELTTIRTPSNPANVHLLWDSPLEFKQPDVVASEALALGAHDAAVQAPAVFVPPVDGHGVQVIAALPGTNVPAITAGLPPPPVNQVVYQPDQARGEVGTFRPALVQEDAQNMPKAAVVEIPDLDMATRRAMARPKAHAPALPRSHIEAVLDDGTALSTGFRPLRAGQLELPPADQHVMIMAPPSAQETEARQAIERETEARRQVAEWLERNNDPAVPGHEAAHRTIAFHDQRIADAIRTVAELRTARMAAARALPRQDLPVPVGPPEAQGPVIRDLGDFMPGIF